jgi:hypothetical protein
MLKNLGKKLKSFAKKAAPYAGIVAGMFGASPLMAAGIGALGGGMFGGGTKGAVLGGLGGFTSGRMYGGTKTGGNWLTNQFSPDNALFDANALIGKGGPGGFFNPSQKGIADLLLGTHTTPESISGSIDEGNYMFTPEKKTSGWSRLVDDFTMETNPLTGGNLKKGSMWKYLPAAMGGTALAYGMGAFDEEPIPEDEIPGEYVYDPEKDPLKDINKRFQDYYQGITQIPTTSIYGFLQSIGALKDGGSPRGFYGGGPTYDNLSIDVPGKFLLDSPAKTPLSVLEAADGTNEEEMSIQEKFASGTATMDDKYSLYPPMEIMGKEVPGVRALIMEYLIKPLMKKGQDKELNEGVGSDKLEPMMKKGADTANKVLEMGAKEALDDLGGKGKRVSDNNELYLTKGQERAVKEGSDTVDMTDAQMNWEEREKRETSSIISDKMKEFQSLIDSGVAKEVLMKLIETTLINPHPNPRMRKSNGGEIVTGTDDEYGSTIKDTDLQILLNNGYSMEEAMEMIKIWHGNRNGGIAAFVDGGPKYTPGDIAGGKAIGDARKKDSQFDEKMAYWNYLNTLDLTPEQIGIKMVEKFGKRNGGIAAFNFGGKIMGQGTGRQDNIPGKIVDQNTGQTSDMLVSNNEHIIPEYALYAMGGGNTEKGHEMLDALRKQTKPMARKMGYDFEGAEQGRVAYG